MKVKEVIKRLQDAVSSGQFDLDTDVYLTKHDIEIEDDDEYQMAREESCILEEFLG